MQSHKRLLTTDSFAERWVRRVLSEAVPPGKDCGMETELGDACCNAFIKTNSIINNKQQPIFRTQPVHFHWHKALAHTSSPHLAIAARRCSGGDWCC
jgi:hypothetical protein